MERASSPTMMRENSARPLLVEQVERGAVGLEEPR